MDILLTVLLAVGVLLIWLIPMTRGAARRADSLEPAVQQLLECNIPGAFLTVRPRYSRYNFIQWVGAAGGYVDEAGAAASQFSERAAEYILGTQ